MEQIDELDNNVAEMEAVVRHLDEYTKRLGDWHPMSFCPFTV